MDWRAAGQKIGAAVLSALHTLAWAGAAATCAGICWRLSAKLAVAVGAPLGVLTFSSMDVMPSVSLWLLIGAINGLLLGVCVHVAARWHWPGRGLAAGFHALASAAGALQMLGFHLLFPFPPSMGVIGYHRKAAFAVYLVGLALMMAAVLRERLGPAFSRDDALRMALAACLIGGLSLGYPFKANDAVSLPVWLLLFTGGVFGQIVWAQRPAWRARRPA